jgi:hypothetical protein
MQIPFDNFFADWEADQIRVPIMNPALAEVHYFSSVNIDSAQTRDIISKLSTFDPKSADVDPIKLQESKLNARLHAFAWQRRHGVREKVRVCTCSLGPSDATAATSARTVLPAGQPLRYMLLRSKNKN